MQAIVSFKWLKRIVIFFLSLILIYLLILKFPEPFFSNKISYLNLVLYSDASLPTEESAVILQTAHEKLIASPLFKPDKTYRIFICNSLWYRLLFFRDPDWAGGQNLGYFSNSFLGPVNILKNQWLKPNGTAVSATRPLDYLIAHELTHQMVDDYLGTFKHLKSPSWINEGYADYIGKGELFNFHDQLKVLKNHVTQDDVWATEYDHFNLVVTYLIMFKKISVEALFLDPPDFDTIQNELERSN